MIETLNQIDHQLMLWLNYDGGSLLDAFWFAVSYKFSWIPLYLAILWVMIRQAHIMASHHQSNLVAQGDAPSRYHSHTAHVIYLVVATALIILAADQLSSGLIKPLVQRPRPSHEPGLMDMLHYVGDYRGGRFGFVSSHAANTIALAVWISLLFRQRALYWAMGTFYAINCYSRIYLGVHYPGDIICGSIVGALCGWAGYIIYNKYCHHQAVSSSPTSEAGSLPQPITLTFWASAVIAICYAAVSLI